MVMKHVLVAPLLVLLLALGAGCASNPSTDGTVKLYVFDCGRLRLDSVAPFGLTDAETQVRDLSVPCYMVEHPAGRLLWDGGLPSVIAQTPGWHRDGNSFFQQRLDKTLAQQLAVMGLDMTSFDFMAYSHLHWDHVGVANEVEDATLLIQRAEYDAAFAEKITVSGGFQPGLYNRLADANKIILDGDHDVFGDGRVRIISAPGHTPGHQVLLVNLADYGPVVIGGDLYHFRFNKNNRRVPRFNFSAPQTLQSMNRINDLLDETGAEYWIEHELAWFEQLKQAPAFYQ
jgi:glyoxylase-like metal-dependent hydrolase (beta-lactamase superfamily II)